MEEIKRLIEARQIEATKKQITLKLLSVVRGLGSPVYGEGGFGAGLGGSMYDPEAWMTDAERGQEMPTAEDEDYSHIGQLYDALSIGHNFEVRYMTYDKELRASYNGFVVYKEEDNKLTAYVPHPVWEDLLDRLYKKSRPAEEARKEMERKDDEAGFMRQAAKFLSDLRKSWGI